MTIDHGPWTMDFFNMKILIFDNYDSFTYNLVHLVEKITHEKVDVYRNDKIPLEKVSGYDKIILSPGPGVPSEAGLLLPLIKEYAATKSILGVCLGHQAIGQAFGGKLVNLSTVYHGVATPVTLNGKGSGKIVAAPDKRDAAIEGILFCLIPNTLNAYFIVSPYDVIICPRIGLTVTLLY